ncbi:hypothetical protein BDU57DRAFT_482325 [Ampelomyces quisqualis]|uniref:N-acetyltransferase domain-containing protein n=1 Tax=Ampelomyces quisqualis TaxID=50730 RepID=A0A6A5QF16_AMPQU|nr:hypothetical protein BDU57DRAFT_482325 [Ampelomyces quisqualis]
MTVTGSSTPPSTRPRPPRETSLYQVRGCRSSSCCVSSINVNTCLVPSCVNPFVTCRRCAPLSLHFPYSLGLEYRLRTCGELCSGIFTSAYPTASGSVGEILKTRQFSSIDSHDTDRKRILLGHVIATKSSSRLVTDEAMDYPKDWQTRYQLTPSTGHNEIGDTVCIHSLCVHPDFQRKGFGHILLKSYIQRIKDSATAKRLSLICRHHFVAYYEKAGFTNIGPSKCRYGGGDWVDMVLEFESEWEDDE